MSKIGVHDMSKRHLPFCPNLVIFLTINFDIHKYIHNDPCLHGAWPWRGGRACGMPADSWGHAYQRAPWRAGAANILIGSALSFSRPVHRGPMPQRSVPTWDGGVGGGWRARGLLHRANRRPGASRGPREPAVASVCVCALNFSASKILTHNFWLPKCLGPRAIFF